ncbi:TPA: YmfQ family protein [Escherichia coli]
MTEWLTALQQVMPRGKAWPRDNDADLNRFLRALAERLTRVEYDASRLHVEMRPETTLQLLPEWEQYLALPECGIAATTTEARRRAVVEKYRRKGGLATWQIEAAAAALGFTIKVTAVLPHHCLRDCMYPLHPARYRWLLKVEVPDKDAGRFTCIDDVMTPLISERTRELECLLKHYRLAGTEYEYYYTGE